MRVSSGPLPFACPGADEISKKQRWIEIIKDTLRVQRSYFEKHCFLMGVSRHDYDRQQLLLEWPFSGICTGVAIDMILHRETTNSPTLVMNPTPMARFFERLLLPSIWETASKIGHSLGDVTIEALGEDVYSNYIERLRTATGLKAIVDARWSFALLEDLGAAVEAVSEEEHHLLVLKGLSLAPFDCHTLYINPIQRIIGDGSFCGLVEVPKDADFAAFLSYYLQVVYIERKKPYTHFSLISVDAAGPLRYPSLVDQAVLVKEINEILDLNPKPLAQSPQVVHA